MSDRSVLSRAIFFEKHVHLQSVKDCLSGSNEKYIIEILESIGFKLGVDFVRQYPFAGMFVFDFAFVNEQVFLEIDGDNHNGKLQKRKDAIRDRYCRENNWIPIRIDDREFKDNYKTSFYKSLIKSIVLDRREDYNNGNVSKRDTTKFNEKDYE